jgi:hypothetical protein
MLEDMSIAIAIAKPIVNATSIAVTAAVAGLE